MAKSKIPSTYEELRGHLDEIFYDFIKDPAKYGVEPLMVEEIQQMSTLHKKGLWEKFKQQFKLKLTQLEQHDLAALLHQDLSEDGVQVASKKTLDAILKDPQNPAYCLEPEMIEAIQSLGKQEIEQLRAETAILYQIQLNESVGHKILAFLQKLWMKLAPTLDKILDKLIDHGVEHLGNAIGTKLDPEFKGLVTSTVGEIGHGIEDVGIKTTTKILDEERKEDMLDRLSDGGKEALGVLGTGLGNAANSAVEIGEKHALNKLGISSVIEKQPEDPLLSSVEHHDDQPVHPLGENPGEDHQ